MVSYLDFAKDKTLCLFIEQCMENPGHINKKNAKHAIAAKTYIDNLPLSQRYSNDKFCVAIAFDLFENSSEEMKEIARNVINNGYAQYWEWETSFGFNMNNALKKLGIHTDPRTQKEFNTPAIESILKQINEIFFSIKLVR